MHVHAQYIQVHATDTASQAVATTLKITPEQGTENKIYTDGL